MSDRPIEGGFKLSQLATENDDGSSNPVAFTGGAGGVEKNKQYEYQIVDSCEAPVDI